MSATAKTPMLPPSKAKLPEELSEAMSLYRQELGALPQGYIDFHARLARAELARLRQEYGLLVRVEEMVRDDFFPDGMRLLRVAVETPSDKILLLQWHDGNQGFMNKGCGWGLLFDSDLS